MPFIPHTPESLIRRSDSKDPATTCKGIIASGRPCRRPLGISPQSSPRGTRGSRNGVVAVLEAGDDEHDGAAAYFCWQHQDQADTLTTGDQNGRITNIIPVQQRTSIDTLVDRLGILDVEEHESPLKRKQQKQSMSTGRKETLPKDWRSMDGPLLAVNSGKQGTRKKNSNTYTPKRQSNLGLFCCVRSVDNDPLPPPRIRPDAEKIEKIHSETSKLPMKQQNGAITAGSANQRKGRADSSISHTRPSNILMNNSDTGPGRPSLSQPRPSQTEDFLSLIPKTLSPQTTSLLLAELAKPISPYDEEGYIYMFWLTDASVSRPDAQAASSMLANNMPSTPSGRRKSDILQSHAVRSAVNAKAFPNATVLLKIGRAINVQRRMNEWTRQCGYSPSLIRFYPHVPSPPSQPELPPSLGSPNGPPKAPYGHKVERLIHIELADQRVKRDCMTCGKQHREWFEVDSSREGLRKVDDTIRRWTSWCQRMYGGA